MEHVWTVLIAMLAVAVALLIDSYVGFSQWLAKKSATASA